MKSTKSVAGKVEIQLTQRQVDLLARMFGYFGINMELDPSGSFWIDSQKIIASMSKGTKREFDQLALSFKILSTEF